MAEDRDQSLHREGPCDFCGSLRRRDHEEAGEMSVSTTVDMDNIEVEAEGNVVPTQPEETISKCRRDPEEGKVGRPERGDRLKCSPKGAVGAWAAQDHGERED